MFELQVVSNTPMTGVDDLDVLAETFLVQIGYLPKGYDPRSAGALSVRDSIPYRLFMDFFMKNPSKAWTAEELAALLDTSKPTIYRHINKLRSMDLLENADVPAEDGQMRKGFRIRYGDLVKAWSFTEANVNLAMENYKKTVLRFQELVRERAEKS
ncbi:MAG: helix-turn-helix transcriptional regulator [Candidatus Methanomethylophilus sp.]|jgi:predicted transcriptional regulator|nr:helix-turn-helix transcriptional regulator [Methanomethylophilus sp.]MBQ5397363.1 helix-turn-helix transcriptional regulator [Methanomethylophilus sp.]MBQ5447410.1 helix-turn-helix transcriptional regulator [Methanomethylophilus sp.]MBQ5483846.1 helix-turn-helix transcriptional regulator [Methanomethylophilus sp.]